MIINGTDMVIPDSLIVEGDLYLVYTNATSLPAGLTVGGDLFLTSTNIKELPADLTVGAGLFCRGTNITSLPEGLLVGGVFCYPRQLIASEKVQLGLIAKGDNMLRVFKAPTEKAKRLHEMMWEL